MLLLLRHPETGLSSLRFKCDCCGKLIDEADGAMVAWNPDREKERECVPVVVCYECDGRDRIPSEFYTQELSTGLIYLLCNTGMIPGTDSFKRRHRMRWRIIRSLIHVIAVHQRFLGRKRLTLSHQSILPLTFRCLGWKIIAVVSHRGQRRAAGS